MNKHLKGSLRSVKAFSNTSKGRDLDGKAMRLFEQGSRDLLELIRLVGMNFN